MPRTARGGLICAGVALVACLGGVANADDAAPQQATGPTLSGMLDALRLQGYLQVDALHLERSSDQLNDGDGEPLNEDRIFVRNARLRLDGDWRYAGFSTELELGTLAVEPRLLEAWFALPGPTPARPWVKLVAGLSPVPFLWESYAETNVQRFFGERSLLSQAFVPGRFDLGFTLLGFYGPVDWALAVQNGQPQGEQAFGFRDPNSAKDFAARVGVDSELGAGVWLRGGVFALFGEGFSPGTPPTKDDFEWRDFNEDGVVSPSELQPIKGSAGRPSENFDRRGLGGDIGLRADLPWIGRLHVYAEIAFGINLDRGVAPADPVLLGRDQRSLGVYGALTQALGPYAMLGVRVEHYEPHFDSLELQGGQTVVARRPFTTTTFAVAGRLPLWGPLQGRLLLEYELQENALGRDARGRPASLPNDGLRVRMELSF